MAASSFEDRIAILLNLLGGDVTESVLSQMSSDRNALMRQRLRVMETSPPSEQEIDKVIDDFKRFFRGALQVSKLPLAGQGVDVSGDNAGGLVPSDGRAQRAGAGGTPEKRFEPSGDPFVDLERLAGFQIAGALREENPRTAALVLNCLAPDKAGEALSLLPPEVRNEAFMKLNDKVDGAENLISRIVQATVEKGCDLDADALIPAETIRDQKIAKVLRSMDRGQRTEVLQVLEEQDAEASARIRQLLYHFVDLLRIEDRSLQKLLAEVDAHTLATALTKAEDDLLAKVLGNLSKRAQQSLSEEMEFLGNIGDDTIDAARKEIVDIILRLDQAGELVLES
jgi:flagellar motor switch protein FliG